MSFGSVKPRTAYVIGGIGLGLAILGGITGWVVVPMILKNQVEQTVAIRSGTEAYERWETLPVTMLFRVYVFEVLNPREITEKGEKPLVKERGPFVYREVRNKKNIRMFEEEDKASYMQESKFEFVLDLSAESNETELVLVNPPALAFAQIAESLPGLRAALHIFNQVIDKMWPDNPIFIMVSVGDYLFNGVDMLCHYERGSSSIEKLMWKAMCVAYAYIRPKKTVIIDDGKPGLNTFSCLKYKQNTRDGPYVVKLGIKEPERIGEIVTWNQMEYLNNTWGGRTCNKVAGTDSTVFRPFLHNVDTLTVFNTDICRSINLTFESETEFKGVPTRRYITGKETLASVLEHPENYCYCPRNVIGLTTIGGCMKSGLLDLSSCQGAEIYMSNPHFYMADPMYRSMVEGLKPDANRHQTFVDIEPYTGYPMRGAVRAQLNMFLKRIPEMDCMKNYTDSLIPFLWIDEGVELTDELVDEVKRRLLNLLRIADIAVWVTIAVGAVMTLAGVFLLATGMKKNE